jgi:oligosaccharyltransferase complex subunit gamma
MWNTIRQPPFIAMGRNGEPLYFAGGFQQQFGIETVIVAFCYSLISFSIIVLTVLAPKMPAGEEKNVVYVGLMLFVVSYSTILLVFRFKNGHYPYKLVFALDPAFLNKDSNWLIFVH